MKNHMAFMHEVNKDLNERGEFVQGEGLAPPDQAKIVNADPSGAPAITDGPFAESKEFLAGWWILDVEDEERAIRHRRTHLDRPRSRRHTAQHADRVASK